MIKYVANNLEELKDRIMDRFADDYPKELGEEFYYNKDLIREQLKALFWLFGEDFKKFKFPKQRVGIQRIIKVFVRKNRRLALFRKISEDEGSLRERFWVKAYTPRDERYNYVSPNREVFMYDDFEIWICDDLFEKLGNSELEVLARRLHLETTNNYFILNTDRYNRLEQSIMLEMLREKRREMEGKMRERLKETIRKQFKSGKVVRNGIEFRKDRISYAGVVLKGEEIGKYIVQQNLIYLEEPDFRKIFEGYVDYILNCDVVISPYSINSNRIDVGLEKKVKFWIGKIGLEIFKLGKNFYVKMKGKKRHRINKGDLPVVVKNAINFIDNPEGYEEYLSRASRINLKLQEALSRGGLEFQLEVEPSSDCSDLVMNQEEGKYGNTILLSLPLLRKNEKNYVVIQGKEYRIKDTRALFDLGKELVFIKFNNSPLNRAIRLLYRAIEGITPEVIGKIIIQGKEEYKKMVERIEAEKREKIEKSLEFLKHAIELTKAKRVNGGYIVRGLSGNLYYVEDDGKVWTVKEENGRYVNDRYLCVIDIGTDVDTEWGKNDCIAKRLLALSKDSVVAKEIYRRGDMVENFWVSV
jgi:hypothetical protein